MKLVDLLMILSLIDLGPLGLYEDIDDARPRARDLCTSYATKNIDYLTTIKYYISMLDYIGALIEG